MSEEHDLTKSLAELGEMIDRSMARIATLEATLAQKQRAIDETLRRFDEYDMTSGSLWEMRDFASAPVRREATPKLLHPEATPTDAKPVASEDVSSAPTSGAGWPEEFTPKSPGQRLIKSLQGLKDKLDEAVPPIGEHHPDDPLVTEWTDDGFRIVRQPEEWRYRFDEKHGGVRLLSVCAPSWANLHDELFLRGSIRGHDTKFIFVPASDRARVWAAIVSLNAKHRKTQTAMSKPIAEAFDDMVEILRGDADVDDKRAAWHTLEEIVFPSVLGDIVFEPQPAQPEPSGDRAVRLVKTLALVVQAMAVRSQLSCQHEVLDTIIAECGGTP